MGAYEAMLTTVSRLGLTDGDREKVERRVTREDLLGVSNAHELRALVLTKALPFLRMQERRKALREHDCPGGRYQGRTYQGNGRCGLCDGYHGVRRRIGW